jgi:transcriptional regulator with XRE-family HTH domain
MQDRKKDLLIALAQIIKNHRGESSISQLAHEVDVSKSIWSQIEHANRDAQFTTLWRIAEALDIKLSNLISDIEGSVGNDFSFIEDYVEDIAFVMK